MKKKKPVFTGKLRIRQGDAVIVIAGKDRGASGKVLRVFPDSGRLIVEGVNKIKRSTRANPQKNIKGGILEREASIAVANVQLKDPETGKPSRIGVRIEGEERVRFAKKSGTTVSAVTAASEE